MRLSPPEELALRWYVLDSDADAGGLRSPTGAMLERARLRQLFDTTTRQAADPERYLVDVRRATAIRDRLRAMGRRLALVLTAAYCSDPVPGLTSAARLGAVAPFTTAAREAYKRATGTTARPRPSTVAGWLAKRWKGNDKLRAEVLAEADALLTDACSTWRASRPRGKAMRVGGHGLQSVFRRDDA